MLFTHLICWQVFFCGLFLHLLILRLCYCDSLFCLAFPFVFLTIWILYTVWKHFLSGTVKPCIPFLILATPALLLYWCNLLLGGLVLLFFCLMAVFCYLGKLNLPYLSLCWEKFLISQNTCLSTVMDVSAVTGACTTACCLSMCWYSCVAVLRPLILPSSLGVRAGELPPVL